MGKERRCKELCVWASVSNSSSMLIKNTFHWFRISCMSPSSRGGKQREGRAREGSWLLCHGCHFACEKRGLLELPFVSHLFAATLLFILLRTVTKVTTSFTSDVFVLQLVAFTSSYRNEKILQQRTRLLPQAWVTFCSNTRRYINIGDILKLVKVRSCSWCCLFKITSGSLAFVICLSDSLQLNFINFSKLLSLTLSDSYTSSFISHNCCVRYTVEALVFPMHFINDKNV